MFCASVAYLKIITLNNYEHKLLHTQYIQFSCKITYLNLLGERSSGYIQNHLCTVQLFSTSHRRRHQYHPNPVQYLRRQFPAGVPPHRLRMLLTQIK